MEIDTKSIWNCRRFWMSLVISDLQLRYRRSYLGVGWSMLLPLCNTIVLGFVFNEIFKVPIREFLPYLFSGLACWTYLTAATLDGCQSYIQAEPYIRQHPLPLAIYPLRTTLGALIHFLVALLLLLILLPALALPLHPRLLVALIPGVVLFFLGGWAVAILAGLVNTVFRDTQHLLQVVFQILFYLTPIIYPVRFFADSSVGWVVSFNPLVYFLELIREPLLTGQPFSLKCLAVVAGTDLVLVLAALAALRFQRRRLIFYL